MEPPTKRPRLSSARTDAEPDLELHHARLNNDLNLKSVFEGIFEKYGKDFSEVGDEVDLETGAIVVNNGHLQSMADEQDVGEDTGRYVRSWSEESEGLFGEDDLEDLPQYQEYEDSQAEPSSPSDASSGRWPGHIEPIKFAGVSSSSPSRPSIPSDASIMEQFGNDFGPQIISYVSQFPHFNTGFVEPAWQTADAPPPIARKRPVLKTLLQPQARKKRPQNSIWAPPRPSPRCKRHEDETSLSPEETTSHPHPNGRWRWRSLEQSQSIPGVIDHDAYRNLNAPSLLRMLLEEDPEPDDIFQACHDHESPLAGGYGISKDVLEFPSRPKPTHSADPGEPPHSRVREAQSRDSRHDVMGNNGIPQHLQTLKRDPQSKQRPRPSGRRLPMASSTQCSSRTKEVAPPPDNGTYVGLATSDSTKTPVTAHKLQGKITLPPGTDDVSSEDELMTPTRLTTARSPSVPLSSRKTKGLTPRSATQTPLRRELL